MEYQLPKTLIEAVTYFSIPENCSEFVARIHWSGGKARCPECDSLDVILMARYQRYHCRECRKQFSIKLGTIFEKSPLPLSKWLPVMWLMANAKNGISSHEIARSVGVTQKTAWFMSHRLREVMRTGTFKKLSGVVEADESFVGGSDHNRHASKKTHKRGRGSNIPVMGMVERGGKVVSHVIDGQTRKDLHKEVRRHVEKASVLYTDAFKSYHGLAGDYYRATVNHREGEYVRGDVHTNTIEGFWALFKRCIKGTHIHLSAFHLDRYLDEECYRYNLRKSDDQARFETGMSQIVGKRLTWNVLTGKAL
jgi:transposase-like protein